MNYTTRCVIGAVGYVVLSGCVSNAAAFGKGCVRSAAYPVVGISDESLAPRVSQVTAEVLASLGFRQNGDKFVSLSSSSYVLPHWATNKKLALVLCVDLGSTLTADRFVRDFQLESEKALARNGLDLAVTVQEEILLQD